MEVSALEEKLRQILPSEFPGSTFSFEPGDLVNQIMNFGAPTPVEVAVVGPNLSASRAFTERLRGELTRITDLRDLKYELPLDYPSVQGSLALRLAKWPDPSLRRLFQVASQRLITGLIPIPASPINCRYSTHRRELPRSKMFKIFR